ncbi:MAG: MFS transporter, partial [Aquincola sp.]|nr:MFS transporter [Aquincola sp.]
ALRQRVPTPRLLAVSATLSAAAMSGVLLVPDVRVAMAGLALVGLGLANVIPILFVSASRIPGASPAAGIALVSSLGWVGVVLGPPLVGGVAQATSLTAGLTLVVVASLALAASARQVDMSDQA